MARKKKEASATVTAQTAHLDLPPQPGVSPLMIAAINKAIAAYETAKERRCNASPDAIAAKNALKMALHAHHGELPMNEKGERFYRLEGVDYVLEEKLKRRKCDEDEGGDED